MAKSTIRNAIDAGDVINAYCMRHGCGYSAQLVLRRLGERLGFDHGCMRNDIIHKLRCSRCGCRDIDLTYSHKSVSAASQHTCFGTGYAKSKGA